MKKPLEENGIHRAKLWEIGFYALNNTSTNIYMMLMSYISYYPVSYTHLDVYKRQEHATPQQIH